MTKIKKCTQSAKENLQKAASSPKKQAFSSHLPDEFYELLPDDFSEIKEIPDKENRDAFLLSFLSLASNAIPNVFTEYGADEKLSPNLYFLLVGEPASGKSIIKKAAKIFEDINRKLVEESQEAYKEYKKNSADSKEILEKPLRRSFFVGTNITTAALVSKLNDNNDLGIAMFSTEGDGLLNSMNSGFGKNMSGILRLAFHNETILKEIKTNDEVFRIKNPKLSVCFSCNPKAVSALFKDGLDNRLASRFMFLVLKEKPPVYGPKKPTPGGFEKLKKITTSIYNSLASRSPQNFVSFWLPDGFQPKVNEVFQKKLNKYCKHSDYYELFLYRLGVSFHRILMLFSIYRNKNSLHQECLNVYAKNEDFEIVKYFLDFLFPQTMLVCESISSPSVSVKIKLKPSGVLLEMPEVFGYKDFFNGLMKKSPELSMSAIKRKTQRWIKKLLYEGKIKIQNPGEKILEYRKIHEIDD